VPANSTWIKKSKESWEPTIALRSDPVRNERQYARDESIHRLSRVEKKPARGGLFLTSMVRAAHPTGDDAL